MRDRPDGPALLARARTLLLDELMPQLPEPARYGARLVANAMAIAAREQAAGERPLEAERLSLAALFGEEALHEAPLRRGAEALDEAVQRLNWRLAAEIRGGHRDANAQIYGLLRESVLLRLRETNPKALERAGRE